MLIKKLSIFVLLSILLDNAYCIRRVGDRRILSLAAATDDCATSLEDNNSIVCRSLVPCTNELFYRQFNRIVFDLTNNNQKQFSIDKQTFNNCLISNLNRQVEIIFRNVQEIKSFAFQQFEMELNTRLTITFDGGGNGGMGKDSQLIVRKNAFNAFHLSKNSQLNIEIMNYKNVIIQDALVKQDNTALIQDQNSSFYLSIHDCDIVVMKPSQDNNFGDNVKLEPPQPPDLFDQNRTYSLQILHVDQVRFDVGIFSDLQIMPYCTVAIEIRSAYSCSMADSSFERLLIGTSARFSLLIQNVNYASIGKNLFKSLEQSAVSSFFFQMDQINGASSSDIKRSKRSLIKNEKLNQYYEEDNPLYDDEEDYDAADDEPDEQDDLSYDGIQANTNKEGDKSPDSQLYDEWFCVPEYLFKNVEQAESSTGQVHFTRFKMSISVSSLAFSEFQLSDNSKFQILFQDLRGHIVFDTKSIDLIRLSDGIFEIWIEDHRQLVNDKGNRQKNKFNSKDSSTTIPKQSIVEMSPLRLLKKARNTHLKLNDLAFNKIFLNSHSLFRIGYINSDSLFLISPKALNGFHIDELATNLNNRQDYRTKISFEIKQSDNLHFEFVSQQDLVTNEEDLSNFPKLIEIDTYEPIMSNEQQDNKILTQVEINMRQQEFCRYFKLRPLIAPLKYKLPNAAFNANSFIYFSVPIKLTGKQMSSDESKNKTKQYCTSCLFIYLYRTLHRRHDFYFIKDYLPSCFITLHYGNNLYLVHKRNSVKIIEQTFSKYWTQLNCEKITGLSGLFQYDVYASNQSSDESILDPKQSEFIGDETFADFERMSKHCRKTQESSASLFSRHDEEIKSIERLSQEKWHDLVPKICSKNVLDATMNNSRSSIRIAQKKYSLTELQKKSRFSWSIFFFVFLLVCSVTVMFGLMYLKYKKNDGNNNIRLLPSNVSHYITQVRSSLKMHRLNNFEQLNNEETTETKTNKKITSVTYNKLIKNDHKLTNDSDDEEDENREEIHFDELNAYEYDDEFGLATTANSSNNNNEQFKTITAFATDSAYVTTTLSNTNSTNSKVLNNLADRFKKMKNNLFNNNALKTSLLSFNNNNNNSASLIPNYTYNSTDASLIQTNIKNEFKSIKETEEEDEDEIKKDKPNVEIVYDIAKQKSKQNIVKTSNINENLNKEHDILRLSTNPLETYLEKIEMNDIKKQELNESDA